MENSELLYKTASKFRETKKKTNKLNKKNNCKNSLSLHPEVRIWFKKLHLLTRTQALKSVYWPLKIKERLK